ncbi:trehalose-phosphatase [Halostagnicola bangensis]
MSVDTPTPVHERLPQIRTALGVADSVLLCLDFDGTLAPIVDDPAAASPKESAVDALDRITSNPTITTAVISGRSLADVRTRIDGPTFFAGNHGLEIQRSGTVSVHPIAKKRAAPVEDVCSRLESKLDPIPHCWVENKRLTGTVHLRSVPERYFDTVDTIVESVTDRLGNGILERSNGKRVIEISPQIPWGKGNAVELLRSSLPTSPLVLYIGDDTTDESAFETVEPNGIGIRVGDETESWASCRVRSPDEVASFLHWIGTTRLSTSDQERERPVAHSVGSFA